MIGKPFNFTWLLGNRFSNDYGINYRTGKFETSYKIRTSSKKKNVGTLWMSHKTEVCDSCWDTDQLRSEEKSTSGRKHAFPISSALSEHKDFECECSCTQTSLAL